MSKTRRHRFEVRGDRWVDVGTVTTFKRPLDGLKYGKDLKGHEPNTVTSV